MGLRRFEVFAYRLYVYLTYRLYVNVRPATLRGPHLAAVGCVLNPG
jgi:hypothetical protein